MAKQKRKSKKKPASGTRKLILLVLIFAILGLLLYLVLPDLMNDEETIESQEKKTEVDLPKETVPLSDVLPLGFEIQIYAEDINGDGNLNTLAHKSLEIPSSQRRALERQDFGLFFSEMIVYSATEGSWDIILEISERGILSQTGQSIIPFTGNSHGFAMEISEFSQAPYQSEVLLFNVVMLDNRGQPASDELTIFWHPAQKTYKATNTFGAEGTF